MSLSTTQHDLGKKNHTNSSSTVSSAQHVEKTEQSGSVLDPEAKPAPQAPTIVNGVEVPIGDWTGPADPENPQNWPMSKKLYNSILPVLLGFVTTFSSSAYASGAAEIAREFHIGLTTSLLGVTLFTLGLAFGPVIAAPLSESYGRKWVYLLCMPLFAIFTMGTGFSKTVAGIMICRFLAGFFGSPTLSIIAGTAADVWNQKLLAAIGCLLTIGPFGGSTLGPVVGGYVAEYKDWRWIQWTTIFFFLFFYVLSLGLSETYKKTILQARNKRLGMPPPPSPLPPGGKKLKMFFFITFFRPLHMLVVEPIVAALSLFIAFNFGVLYAFFAAYPYVFETVYNFGEGAVGLTFIGVFIGVLLAALTGTVVDRFYYHKRLSLSKTGFIAPEHRLIMSMIAAPMIPISLFWFGWTARSDIHWISPVLAGVAFGFGNTGVFISGVLYFINTYPAMVAASAVAASGILRYIFGGVLPLVAIPFFKNLHIHWAATVLGCISVLLVPMPFLLFRFGPWIRSKSSYDTIKYS